MNARDVLYYGHGTVLRAIDGLPRDKWVEPGVVGYWSVKNIISHLASFEMFLNELLDALPQGGSMPIIERLVADPQRFNDVEVDQKRADQSPADAWDEYVTGWETSMRLLDEIPEAERRVTGALPWYGEEYDLEDFLAYTFYGHKREHCAQIMVYRDKLNL
ncbi:MAG TPA: maleylpyruvate isomerase N-terminal domain-containing protein [Anaerolineae bacterium]|jgi:hypothetical protein|nr:maleylpyruvate isomerase N-terminal domain-containing protein [Anaerolineae bacterium]